MPDLKRTSCCRYSSSVASNLVGIGFADRVRTHILGVRGSGLSALLFAAMLLGSAGQARAVDDQQPNAQQAKVKKVKKTTHADKKAKSVTEARAGARPVTRTPAPPVNSEFARLQAIEAELGWQGWTTGHPVFYDSLLMDAGGWRSKLAEYGIGLIGFEGGVFANNMLNTPRTTNGQQTFWGQKASAYSPGFALLTVDMSKYGIDGGMIQAAGVLYRSSFQTYFPDAITLSALEWRQQLFNGKVVLAFGLMNLPLDFAGTVIGGSLFSPFGNFSSILPANGGAYSPLNQPAVEVTWNITDRIYTIAAVGRSANPAGTLADLAKNPTQTIPFPTGTGQRAVVMNEWGYKQEAAPNTPYLWARVGGIYNNSPYTDFSNLATGGTSETMGMYAIVDYQFMQFDPTSPAMAYRGMYVGGSFNYGPPETNLFSQYYEARYYIKGPWASRPGDMFSLSYSHIGISKDFANFTNMLAPVTGTFAPTGVNNVTVAYTYRVAAGVYVTGGLGYTDKPAIPFTKDTGSALNLLGAVSLVF
jgi:porin